MPIKPRVGDSGLHITRAELHSARLEANLQARTNFSSDEKRRLLIGHRSLTTPIAARELLRAKFLRAGRRIAVDGTEIGTIGRYHHARSCLYFSNHRDGVLAEAAYYMHIHDGVKVGSFGREYRIISAVFAENPVDITRHYLKLDLYCDCHPLQKVVEDNANTSGWTILIAPSVRRVGRQSIIVYDIVKVHKEDDLEKVRLFYDAKNPTVTVTAGNKRRAFVIRTTVY